MLEDIERLSKLDIQPIILGIYLDGEHWPVTSINRKSYALTAELRRIVIEKRKIYVIVS